MQVSQAKHHTKETSNLLRVTVIFSLRSDTHLNVQMELRLWVILT